MKQKSFIETKVRGGSIKVYEPNKGLIKVASQAYGETIGNLIEIHLPIEDVKEFISNVNEMVFGSRNTLPSHYQIGDSVSISFGTSGVVSNCTIIKVHFSESKVLYDLVVEGNFDAWEGEVDEEDIKINNKWSTRLYNVDSAFVTPPKLPTLNGITPSDKVEGIYLTTCELLNIKNVLMVGDGNEFYFERQLEPTINLEFGMNYNPTSRRISRKAVQTMNTLDLTRVVIGLIKDIM